MRPTSINPSFLKQPFNGILGTETSVRVLRVLCESDVALGKSEVARRAALNDSGVRRTLETLVALGIVEPAAARTQAVRLRRDHPLAPALMELFEAERLHYHGFVAALRAAVATLSPVPITAWLDGVDSYGSDAAGALTLSIVTQAGDVNATTGQLHSALEGGLASSDVYVSSRVLTRADLTASPEEYETDLVLLAGPHPETLAGKNAELALEESHGRHDERQAKIAAVVADWLVDDPELITRTVHHLRTAVDSGTPSTDPRAEWLGLLERQSVAALRRILLDPGEDATRRRQSLPFLAVLSNVERQQIERRVADE